jgi:hypothetical protein
MLINTLVKYDAFCLTVHLSTDYRYFFNAYIHGMPIILSIKNSSTSMEDVTKPIFAKLFIHRFVLGQ